jgi:hypothetical protein
MEKKQGNYWDTIGVGLFEKHGTNFLGLTGQMLVGCTAVDLVVQYAFLRWGVLRHDWKVPGTFIGGGNGGSGSGSGSGGSGGAGGLGEKKEEEGGVESA